MITSSVRAGFGGDGLHYNTVVTHVLLKVGHKFERTTTKEFWFLMCYKVICAVYAMLQLYDRRLKRSTRRTMLVDIEKIRKIPPVK